MNMHGEKESSQFQLAQRAFRLEVGPNQDYGEQSCGEHKFRASTVSSII